VVILRIEDKVHSYNGRTHCHHAQNGIHQKHEPVHVVELVRPESCEDEVHLDEDRAEGQDTSRGNDEIRVCIPSGKGNRPRFQNKVQVPILCTENIRYVRWNYILGYCTTHLGMLLTLHGGSYFPIQCLPNMVPATERGRETKSQMASICER
jgi:hypothetical protein